MHTDLFQPIRAAQLVDDLERALTAPQDFTAPLDDGRSQRAEALAVLDAYPLKDGDGRPTQPPASQRISGGAAEIYVTADEAKGLGVVKHSVSVAWLEALLQTDRAGTLPASAQSIAAHLLESAPRRPLGYIEAMDNFARARKAYDYLSAADPSTDGSTGVSPATTLEAIPRAVVGGPHSAAVLRAVKDAAATQEILLLTQDEHKDAVNGKLANLVPEYFSAKQQRMRSVVNLSVRNARVRDEEAGLIRTYVHAPHHVKAVAAMMELDPLAHSLLNNLVDRECPVIPFYADERSVDKDGRIFNGFYNTFLSLDEETGRSTKIDYVALAMNRGNLVDQACTGAHEARHLWQGHLPAIQCLRAATTVDAIILDLLYEADAHAVTSKIQSSLIRKTGQTPLLHHSYIAFDAAHEEERQKGVASGQALKNATEARFFDFIVGELTGPAYLKSVAAAFLRTPITERDAGKAIAGSAFLEPHILEKLSEVAPGHSYLDKDRIAALRKLFLEHLPPMLARYEPSRQGFRPSLSL